MAKKKKKKNLSKSESYRNNYEEIETTEFDVLSSEDEELISWGFFIKTYIILVFLVAILFRLYFLLYWGN